MTVDVGPAGRRPVRLAGGESALEVDNPLSASCTSGDAILACVSPVKPSAATGRDPSSGTREASIDSGVASTPLVSTSTAGRGLSHELLHSSDIVDDDQMRRLLKTSSRLSPPMLFLTSTKCLLHVEHMSNMVRQQ